MRFESILVANGRSKIRLEIEERHDSRGEYYVLKFYKLLPSGRGKGKLVRTKKFRSYMKAKYFAGWWLLDRLEAGFRLERLSYEPN